jgi:cell fate regulator YaaT (PSP1 superfamily)
LNIYGVAFDRVGKVHKYFSEEEFKRGEMVIAESEFGLELGEIVKVFDSAEEEQPEKPILRKASFEEMDTQTQNEKDAKVALNISKEKVVEHDLPMKMLRAKYVLDRSKLVFFFSADGRVDFRALVKELATVFKTRIELRQVGIRDAAKMIGGIGLCGMQTCCSRFERDFKSITLKYAKAQQLMINPSKISGACGRLLCCLAFENDTYLEILKDVPDVGEKIEYENELYMVSELNIFHKTLKARNAEGKTVILPFEEVTKLTKKDDENGEDKECSSSS